MQSQAMENVSHSTAITSAVASDDLLAAITSIYMERWKRNLVVNTQPFYSMFSCADVVRYFRAFCHCNLQPPSHSNRMLQQI
jgi:hypothetical protein